MRTKLLFVAVLSVSVAFPACAPPPTSSDVQRERQEKMVSEGVAQIGMPAIKNFREAKLAKDLYELRDQTGLVTYTYTFSEMTGKLTFFCDSVGYAIPYATQFSAPESMQRFSIPKSGNAERQHGVHLLPQAEPNGLFTPAAAEGTWVFCKDPNGKEVRPVYLEPRVIVSQFKLKTD